MSLDKMEKNLKNRSLAILSTILLIIPGIISFSTIVKSEYLVASNNDSCLSTDVDENISRIMEQNSIPSISACIIKNNSIVWYKGYGYYDKFFKKKPTADTDYLAGSVSKAITATALMQLYEQNKFKLNDDVNKYLPFSLRNPNYPNEPITFEMLLSHQSSLSGEGSIKTLVVTNMVAAFRSYKEYLVPGGRWYDSSLWTTNHPGKAFNYSNLGFGILSYLVEILSSESFNNYCKQHIFKPLKMYNTSFKLNDLKRRNVAVPYMEGKSILLRLPRYAVPISGAGGLITSINDISHFLIANMNGGLYNGVRILNESNVNLMHTIHAYVNSSGYYYGLGWMFFNQNGTMYEGHHGDTFGSHARMKYRETDKTGVIFLLNGDPYLKDREKINLFLNSFSLIFEELFKKADKL